MLEAELEGINLIIQNWDKPGVIGHIGMTLGNFKVNIANMHLARSRDRDKALAIVRLDNEAPRRPLRPALAPEYTPGAAGEAISAAIARRRGLARLLGMTF